ncbi:MAG TPA: ferritin-like domain-containing protein [Rubrivivax sp.]|nr:ferritin-like domain-containing protein [Rubrivivax sp.]
MTQSSGFHEDPDLLTPATRDRHRAIVSLMEELDAVDWYDQRIDATRDDELREILAHNRDEEKEHAAMVLEWLRRRDPGFDRQLRDYLFSPGSVMQREQALEAGTAAAAGAGAAAATPQTSAAGDGSLRIGSLRKEVQA